MKCVSCGGALQSPMNFCPYCGVRQDIDLRQLHFRDLSETGSEMPCPQCERPLNVIEVGTTPPMTIERCGGCFGIFFNPGELEAVLHHQTEDAVRFDGLMLAQVASDFQRRREVTYRKCPMCLEPMSHVNFGGRSGVIVDRCMEHGLWLSGGDLRRLAEWWRAGGKLIHGAHEANRVGKMFNPPKPKRPAGSIEPPGTLEEWVAKERSGGWTALEILGDLAAWMLVR